MRLSDLVAGLIILAVGSVFVAEQHSKKDAQSHSTSINGLAGGVRSAAAFKHSGRVEDGLFGGYLSSLRRNS